MRPSTGSSATPMGLLSYLSAYLVIYAVFLILYRVALGAWSWWAPLGVLVATEIYRLTAHVITAVISPAPGNAVRPAADAPSSPNETDRQT